MSRRAGWVLAPFLLSCHAFSPRSLEPDALTETEVRSELAIVERTLRDAYAGRSTKSDYGWTSMVKAVREIPVKDQTTRSLCRELVMKRFGDRIDVLDPSGKRCTLDGRTVDPKPFPKNIASDEKAVLRRLESGVVAVGIRSFDADVTLPEGTLGAVDHARAVIVDLRNSVGDDPRPLVPLLERLLGAEPFEPIRAIEVQNTPLATRLRSEMAPGHGRDRDAWRSLVANGPPREPRLRPRADDVPLFVLVGGLCDGPCQLAARVLRDSGNTYVVGLPKEERSLDFADFVDVPLGQSGLVLRVPTAYYAPSAEYRGMAYGTSVGGSWPSSVMPPRTGFSDTAELFDQAAALARVEIERRERRRRFDAVPPPACASLPAVATPQELPVAARERFSGSDLEPGVQNHVRVWLTLSAERARAFLTGCPGLTVGSINERPGLTDVRLYDVTSFEPLSRLLRTEALEYLSVERVARAHPN